ncbi:Transcription elongation factor Spt4 [Candidatus Bilamarchaeum dharawalense]|uniref:Transcription elongation factor Spt4 n=1 Tax=Candidatus Bilamarchaeum dharawalense TaxID=2885759 RepID=A0A5E4LRX0_9ARCH|nr:Transcription elongation factor Spt4 [Candidatus Bilamarchaeum dharawalense]
MSACKQCRYIVQTKDKVCPKCQGELSEKYSGMVVILDAERSEVAKIVEVNVVGSYAVKVR